MLVLQKCYLHYIVGSNSVTTKYFFIPRKKPQKILLRFSKLSESSQQASQQYFVSGESDVEMAPDVLSGWGSALSCGALLPGKWSYSPRAGLFDQTMSPPMMWCSLPFKHTTPGGKRTSMKWPVAMRNIVRSFTAPSLEAVPWHHCKALLNLELAQNKTHRMCSTDMSNKSNQNISVKGYWIVLIESDKIKSFETSI